jgi:hypothetical protein
LPIFAILALLATLLVIVGPLVSRWQRGGVQPPVAMAAQAVAAASQAPATMPGMHHHHHPSPATQASPPVAAPQIRPDPAAPADPHAGHDMGADCEYCLLAARLLPWLVFALLVLPLLRAPAPRVHAVLGQPGKAWQGHLGARGPPRGTGLTLSC